MRRYAPRNDAIWGNYGLSPLLRQHLIGHHRGRDRGVEAVRLAKHRDLDQADSLNAAVATAVMAYQVLGAQPGR